MHTIGQASAVVYKLNCVRASSACGPLYLYGPVCEVRMAVQLFIAAISPGREKVSAKSLPS